MRRLWSALLELWRVPATLRHAQRSVRGKLLRIVLLTTGIALVTAGIAMLTHDLNTAQQSWIADLKAQASILATSSAPALAFDDRDVAQQNVTALQVRPTLLVAALYAADATLYASYVRPGESPPPARLNVPASGAKISGANIEFTQPVLQGGEQLGTIYLRAQHDIASRVRAYLGIFGLVTLMSMLVALVLSTALQRVITEPLDAMATVARQVVNRRDYSLRANPASDDEIGIAVEAFNGMLDEVQSRARALEQSNAALQSEIEVRQSAEAALARANSRLESTMEALREADRRKDEFLATLAHELRNPLAPIRHAVKLMEAPAAEERQRQWGREVIARQVQRMALLLDDLLDVSRITRGRLELRKDIVELSSLVGSAVETARPLIDAKHHTLKVELPEEPLRLEVDPLRLSQALSNLLTNAAKYTDAHGQITLSAALEGNQLAIRVTDTGIGIEARVIPHVFEMFSQIDSAIDRAEGGLGIGLALVKGLVGLHGGTVRAASAGLGQGSQFEIRLPRTAVVSGKMSAGRPHGTDPVSAGPRCKVLVADDNRDAADSLGVLLELAGYEARVAYTGSEALDIGMRERPRAFVLDVGMPDMTGYEVARRLRQHSWGRDVLLVAVTGWGQEDDKEKARAAGFDAHFTKPVDPDHVRRVLAAFLRERQGDTSNSDDTGPATRVPRIDGRFG